MKKECQVASKAAETVIFIYVLQQHLENAIFANKNMKLKDEKETK